MSWTQRARVGSKSWKTQGLAGYALSGMESKSCKTHSLAGGGSRNCRTHGLAGHALHGPRMSSCFGQQNSLSRARRHSRCLERSPSSWGCSGCVFGLPPRLLLLLLVCCARRSIHIDEPLAVGHRGALGLSGLATVRGSRPPHLLSLHRASCAEQIYSRKSKAESPKPKTQLAKFKVGTSLTWFAY